MENVRPGTVPSLQYPAFLYPVCPPMSFMAWGLFYAVKSLSIPTQDPFLHVLGFSLQKNSEGTEQEYNCLMGQEGNGNNEKQQKEHGHFDGGQ